MAIPYQPYSPGIGDGGQLAADIRLDMVGELQVINQYLEHAHHATLPQAAALFNEIANDERHHLMELLLLLLHVDPEQNKAHADVFARGMARQV